MTQEAEWRVLFPPTNTINLSQLIFPKVSGVLVYDRWGEAEEEGGKGAGGEGKERESSDALRSKPSAAPKLWFLCSHKQSKTRSWSRVGGACFFFIMSFDISPPRTQRRKHRGYKQ